MRSLFLKSALPTLLGPLSTPLAAEECPGMAFARMVAPSGQAYKVRERVKEGEYTFVAIVFDEVAGTYAKKYLFLKYRGDCPLGAVTVGSYAYLGDKQGQTFHLDYYGGADHATLGFRDGMPEYDEMRDIGWSTLMK